jgi:uncharacterized protein (TIGR03083 family)
MALDYLTQLRDESARFADVLRGADPGAAVPTCPDWTADDLLWHLGEVQFFWAVIVRDRLTDPAAAQAAKPDRPADRGALLDFFDAASAALVDSLGQASDDDAIWTWFPPEQDVGFARRRQAHEAVIHRVDAELAAGSAVASLDPDLATDGIDEVLAMMYDGWPDWATHHRDGPIGEIATTDTAATWLVQLGRWSGTSPKSGTAYASEPTISIIGSGEPTFTVRGAASDLDLWLWNRPAGAVEKTGESTMFEAVIRGGVQ